MNLTNTPIPDSMKHMPRDKRGFLVPFVVQWDAASERPYFTINDARKTAYAIQHELCHICGKKLSRAKWFVGGPQSAFHRHGVYIDGPMHFECGRYAMTTCPWLAAPRYNKRIDDMQVDWSKMDPAIIGIQDNTQDPDRPPVFIFAATVGKVEQTEARGNRYLNPLRRWWKIEHWQHRQQITREAALAIWQAEGKDMSEWVFMETRK